MADTITGPGLGGGPSEIAAVSVGVYVVNNTGLGFAAIQGQAAVEGEKLAVAGRKAGGMYGDGFVGGALEQGHQLRRIGRAFHHSILGFLIAPTLIREAFHLGTEIGEALFDGQRGDRERFEKQQEETAKRIADIQIKYNEEARKAGANIDPEGVQELRARRDRLLKDVVKDQEELNTMRYGALNVDAQHRESLERDIDVAQKQIELINTEISALREKARAVLDTSKVEDEARAAEGLRLRAQSPVFAERMAADMSRIRQLMELGTRQRFPSSAGGSVIRGGGVR